MNKKRATFRSQHLRSFKSHLAIESLELRQMLAGDTDFWVYYGKGDTLYRSLGNGTQEQALMSLSILPGPVKADHIQFDLDRVNRKIYVMANQGHNPIHLYRANLDGTGAELLNNSDPMGTILQGIAVNELTQEVYISPHSLQVRTPGAPPGGMLRITDNGQSVTRFSQKPWYVTDMEVDAANGYVYYAVWPSWCCNQTQGWAGIRRMNLDGSNDIAIIETGGNGQFALDIANNRIWFGTVYSALFQNDHIYSVALDGTNVQSRVHVSGYSFGDIDLSDSKDHIAFISFPHTGNPNPNPRMQQVDIASLTVSPLFDIPSFTSGIELLEVNLPPTLDSISNRTIDEDAALQIINLTGISAGPGESQPLRVTATSSNPSLIPKPNVTYTSPNSTGAISFIPVSNQWGTSTITVSVEDGGLDNDLSTLANNATTIRSFTVTIEPVNDPPVASDDSFEITADPVFQRSFEEMLLLASDPDLPNDTISLVADSYLTSIGSQVDIKSQQGLRYEPRESEAIKRLTRGQSLQDKAYFEFRDSSNTLSNKGILTLTIQGINDPPIAVPDRYVISINSSSLLEVLHNDFDFDENLDLNGLELISQPNGGSVVVKGDKIEFVPSKKLLGSDSFSYRVRDLDGTYSYPSLVDLTLTEYPEVVADEASTKRDQSVDIDVLSNDISILSPLDSESLEITTSPNNGTASVVNGKIRFSPDPGFLGETTFAYKVRNKLGINSTASNVSITVSGSKFHNTPDKYDVNNDAVVNAIDPLVIINDLNRNGARDVGEIEGEIVFYFDVDNNFFVNSMDALVIINYLNNRNQQGEGEVDTDNHLSRVTNNSKFSSSDILLSSLFDILPDDPVRKSKAKPARSFLSYLTNFSKSRTGG